MKQKKESVRLRTGILKSSSQRKTEKMNERVKKFLHDLWDIIKRTNM